MKATRQAVRSTTKYQQAQKAKTKARKKQHYDFLHCVMEEMNETNNDPDILIPLNGRVEMMEEEMKNKSFVLVGPGHSGKSSTVRWSLRNATNKEVIWLDCAFWQSENSFIIQLISDISGAIKKYLKKDLVIKGDISFKQLNKEIKKAGVEITIVIKNPQKLIDHKRPVILYNIFEWMNFSQSPSDNLNFVILTRQLQSLQTIDKRIKSRMNIPIIFLARPKADKIKELITKRIDHCCKFYPKKEELAIKLKKALEHKEIEKIINDQYDLSAHPLSHYLKIMQLILAIGIESEEKWELLKEKDICTIVEKGFREYGQYIVDQKVMAKSLFSISHLPEIVLLGLYRNRFLRQKEGSYNSPITLGELMNDYNNKKKRVQSEGGSSFLYSQNIMQNALKNLIDWTFIGFVRQGEKLALINRQIFCRYGPQDIIYLYRSVRNVPLVIKSIFEDQA